MVLVAAQYRSTMGIQQQKFEKIFSEESGARERSTTRLVIDPFQPAIRAFEGVVHVVVAGIASTRIGF
jgi:hypothetical protein